MNNASHALPAAGHYHVSPHENDCSHGQNLTEGFCTQLAVGMSGFTLFGAAGTSPRANATYAGCSQGISVCVTVEQAWPVFVVSRQTCPDAICLYLHPCTLLAATTL